MDNKFKRYILFWFSGSVSQLGSSMTSFALILWTYTQTGSAMSVSLMTFCWYLPYIIVSVFASGFIDKYSKKKIMLVSDFMSATCSLIVLLMYSSGKLEISHIYIVNCVIGFMNAFQSPAQSVAIGQMVPKDKLSQVSGMDSFASNLVCVFSPMLSSTVFALGGLSWVIIIDLLTFIFAFIILLVYIKIPEVLSKTDKGKNILYGSREGFKFLYRNKGLWYMVLTFAGINFVSRLTYENILSPMILARSNNSAISIGVVNAIIGIGGILGGLIVSTGKVKKNPVKMIYICAAFSFLFGDLLMGIGRNTFWWSIAGFAASFPIPFIMAGQKVVLYRDIPTNMQGSVFAIRNAIQFSTIPIGVLLGGFLADYVFEPLMKSELIIAEIFRYLVGIGAGSGMSVMFLCTGILGFICSIVAYKNGEIQDLMKIHDSE